ncbi:MAG: enoyl-CoA hydratase [Amphritea sp.]
MNDQLLIQRNGSILELTMNRPDKKNALTLAMYNQLSDALKSADADPKVRVIFLTGAGESFTAGNDIADFIAALNQPDAVQAPLGFLQTITTIEKPIVAAVPGAAVGIGTTMLLHCDLVFASEQARFQLPFTRLGLVPEGGASFLLPHLVGHRQAFELLVMGEAISAQRAQQLGIVNEIYHHEQLLEQARHKAATLAALAPESVRQSKAMLRSYQQAELQQVLVSEIEQFAKRLQSPEAHEALNAFMEKRAPDFSRF